MSAMTTLTGFVLAMITEEEAEARAAKPGPWHWEGNTTHHGSWLLATAAPAPDAPNDKPYSSPLWNEYCKAWERRTVAGATASDDYGAYIEIDDADADHIARWDPARVLAECRAKRRIVEPPCWDGDDLPWDGETDEQHHLRRAAETQCRLRATWELAQPYADHPNFRPGWNPNKRP